MFKIKYFKTTLNLLAFLVAARGFPLQAKITTFQPHSAEPFIEYVQGKVVPTQRLKDVLCSQNKSKGSTQLATQHFLLALQKFEKGFSNPFSELEQIKDIDVQRSFHYLRLIIRNNSVSQEEFQTAVTDLNDKLENAKKTTNKKINIPSLISKLIAKEASFRNFKLSMSLKVNIILDPGYYIYLSPLSSQEKHLIVPYVYYPEDNKDWSTYINTNFTSEPYKFHIMDEELLWEAMKIQYAQAAFEKDPESISIEKIALTQKNSIVLQTLLNWSKNPKEKICNDSEWNEMDWCIQNDGAFLLQFSEIATQANKDAQRMRDSPNSSVKGLVVINAKSCSVQGSYQLLKTPSNEILLYTSGDLLITTTNSSKKSRFDEWDLMSALLDPTPQFKLLESRTRTLSN